MLSQHEPFYPGSGKRQILVVDDEIINREMLGLILEADYDVIEAQSGEEALRVIREQGNAVSLVLLDLLMPGMGGMGALRAMKANPETQRIPVIVLTADQSAEVESLRAGASDFIPKPYPQPEVILARILRTIELYEDRDIIRSTERDPLTGLYNRAYFYRYAEQLDSLGRDADMDAIVVDVYHFHMINERYGRAYGDEVLRRIGETLAELTGLNGAQPRGVACRQEGDTFMVYCPHREDYRELLARISAGAAGEGTGENRIRLRMGVYPSVDRTLDMERRFDRAKTAADASRNSYANAVSFYDSSLHESELYAEQLLEGFYEAMETGQFRVYYQPKFDVRPEIPVLTSAEALVRWFHPTLGMISPGVFIPLFEKNGLIRELDHYVWREAAARIRDWKNRFGFAVPVSVNISRIDMYDPGLIDTIRTILSDQGLKPAEFLLEITESAYTQDSEQIIATVNRLRELGFKIEMDDFGTGYSSLNMISRLPIDALKLDMQFIRNAFRERRDTRMLEVIIDIAEYLSVPTIAEGVETEEQYRALKAMGCDIVQGYYFSRPVPAEEYERFVLERRDLGFIETDKAAETASGSDGVFGGEVDGAVLELAGGYESIFYVDTASGRYVEFSAQGREEDLGIVRSGADFFGDVAADIPRVIWGEDREKVSRFFDRKELLSRMAGGDRLSLTYRTIRDGAPVYYTLRAVPSVSERKSSIVIGVTDIDALVARQQDYEEARALSVTYSRIAQALSGDYFSIYYVDAESDSFVEFSPRGSDLSGGNLELQVVGSGRSFFSYIRERVETGAYPDDRERALSVWERERLLPELENGKAYSVTYRILTDGRPVYMNYKITRLNDGDGHHIVVGVSSVDAQMKREAEFGAAREKAYRDSLTGVKTKFAYAETEAEYNRRIEAGEADPFAVAFCDLNGLKSVNDTRGHQAGDRFIQDASRIICTVFRHSPVFRVGGDEFIAVLRGSDYERRNELAAELERIDAENRRDNGIIIACGISAYVPGADKSMGDVVKRADAAMYVNKDKLKCGR